MVLRYGHVEIRRASSSKVINIPHKWGLNGDGLWDVSIYRTDLEERRRPYRKTTRLVLRGNSMSFTIPSEWGLDYDERVFLIITDMEEPLTKEEKGVRNLHGPGEEA